jgi:hypothetical protein
MAAYVCLFVEAEIILFLKERYTSFSSRKKNSKPGMAMHVPGFTLHILHFIKQKNTVLFVLSFLQLAHDTSSQR